MAGLLTGKVNYFFWSLYICFDQIFIFFRNLVSGKIGQLSQGTGICDTGEGYKSCHCHKHLAALQSISVLYITYSIIEGELLSYHATMVWEIKEPWSR